MIHRIRALPISVRHQRVLQWFYDNAGKLVTWPLMLADGTLLAARPKGIYKPGWTEYAISVRETLGKTYPDQEPTYYGDGRWVYLYHQESRDPASVDLHFTNRALLACYKDQIPVGVIRQVSRRPRSTYHVLGLGVVRGWHAGYFRLEEWR